MEDSELDRLMREARLEEESGPDAAARRAAAAAAAAGEEKEDFQEDADAVRKMGDIVKVPPLSCSHCSAPSLLLPLCSSLVAAPSWLTSLVLSLAPLARCTV